MSKRPRIGITVGDAAGVGPEISLYCVADPSVLQRCQPILYGPAAILEQVADQLELPFLSPCVDIPVESVVTAGKFSGATGRASHDAFQRAIDDTLAKKIDAIVTGPIQKEAWHAAGIPFPGHTEVLANRTGVDDFCMMLTSQEISCVLATIHIPLADIPSKLNLPLVIRTIRLAAEALTRRLGRAARVVVCGLNPHAGENGLFSHGEEANVIAPAVEQCRAEGIDVVGPVSPDTAFTPSARAQTDVYVCMYHDQGLIPLKALSFDNAVNVTLGLPIVRTSVDHGTAMDLAWKGEASHHSMIAAIGMAVDLVIGNRPQ